MRYISNFQIRASTASVILAKFTTNSYSYVIFVITVITNWWYRNYRKSLLFLEATRALLLQIKRTKEVAIGLPRPVNPVDSPRKCCLPSVNDVLQLFLRYHTVSMAYHVFKVVGILFVCLRDISGRRFCFKQMSTEIVSNKEKKNQRILLNSCSSFKALFNFFLFTLRIHREALIVIRQILL